MRWGEEEAANEAAEAWAVGAAGESSLGRSKRWPCVLGQGPLTGPADDRVVGKDTNEMEQSRNWSGRRARARAWDACGCVKVGSGSPLSPLPSQRTGVNGTGRGWQFRELCLREERLWKGLRQMALISVMEERPSSCHLAQCRCVRGTQ